MDNTRHDRRRRIFEEIPSRDAVVPTCKQMVVKVVNDGAIPTTVPKYFACQPVTLDGAESEGSTRSLIDGTGRVYVAVLGPAVPMAGDYLVASAVGDRWAAQKQTSGVTPGICGFTYPKAWTYYGTHPIDPNRSFYDNEGTYTADVLASHGMTYGSRPIGLPAACETLDSGGGYTPFTLPDNAWWAGPIASSRLGIHGWYTYLWGSVVSCNIRVIPIRVAPSGPNQYYVHYSSPLSASLTSSPNTVTPFHAERWINHIGQTVPGAGGAHLISVDGTHGGDDIADVLGNIGT